MNQRRAVGLVIAYGLFSGLLFAQVSATGSGSASTSASAQAGQFELNATEHTSVQGSGQVNGSKAKSDHSKKNNSKHQPNFPTSTTGSLVAGTNLSAILVKSLDSNKCKQGDEVTAKLTDDVRSEGHIVIPNGAKIRGHITEAAVRAEDGTNSSLGIVFDHAILKNGQQIRLNTVIQAMARAQSSAMSSGDDDELATNARGGVSSQTRPAQGGAVGLGGAATGAVASTAGRATGSVVSAQGVAGSALGSTTRAAGSSIGTSLKSSSSGVVGLKGISLASSTATAAQGTVITSTAKSVHLDSGTQLVLRVVE